MPSSNVRIWVLLRPGCFCLAFISLQAAPVVMKVEPPNWWTRQALNPVRLLVRGTSLKGAVLSVPAGLSAGRVTINENGTYLFADIDIPPETHAGNYPLQLRTNDGTATIPFHVDEPLNPSGRFAGFSPDDVIYLVMPDRFANGDPSNDDPVVSKGLFGRSHSRLYHGGDLQGIIDHLSYLKELGVTALWLTPIYDNSNRPGVESKNQTSDYHGYGTVDYYAVEEHFGTLALLRKMVDEAHRLGLKVIQDQVANHCGPNHPWVANPPTSSWFNGTAAHHLTETFNLWNLIDPHASPDLIAPVLGGWFADVLPDLNQDDPEVRIYEMQNALWWIGETGFDGIRQDTLPYVPRNFWAAWSKALKVQYPQLRVVGEVFDSNPAITSYFQGGREHGGVDTGIDTVFDYPVYFALRDVFAHGKKLEELIKMVANDHLYPNPASLVTFYGNHDVSRFVSEKNVTFDRLRLLLTFLMTARGTPVVYYGDEIGMPGGDDPDNRRDFPGGWPGDAQNAFTASGRTAQQSQIFDFTRKLTRLRAQLSPLRRGEMTSLAEAHQSWVYARHDKEGAVIIAINNDEKDQDFIVTLAHSQDTYRAILTGSQTMAFHNGVAPMHLPAGTAEIYTVVSPQL